jgi:cellulose synthase/poly-beta-1,6-N-acetylglucosamine synthase-like glycosyltransferase
MSVVFWCCAALIAYMYLGYPFALWCIARYRTRPVLTKRIAPTVSIILVARDEEQALSAKLENLRNLSYPRELIQTIAVSDGSRDATAGLLLAEGNELEPIIFDIPRGKAVAINEAVRRATGEILVFVDVRESIAADALLELTASFWDPEVGCVCGEVTPDREPDLHAYGFFSYWNIERLVRRLESASGSVVGVTGAIYAIRRTLYRPIAKQTVLDDVVIPMHVVKQGKRVVYQPSAIARDLQFRDRGQEFSRKVRAMMGNLQLLRLEPWLLTSANPIRLRFVSHKFLRLLCPLLLVMLFVASGKAKGILYQGIFVAQIVFYCVAAFGTIFPLSRRIKCIAVVNAFVILNAAATLALCNLMIGKLPVWRHGVN